jgi:hypothetical protein
MADGQEATPAKVATKKKSTKKGSISQGNIETLAETIKQMVELARLEERADAMRKQLDGNKLSVFVLKPEKKKQKTTNPKKPKNAMGAVPHTTLKPKKASTKRAAEQGEKKKKQVIAALPAPQL